MLFATIRKRESVTDEIDGCRRSAERDGDSGIGTFLSIFTLSVVRIHILAGLEHSEED